MVRRRFSMLLAVVLFIGWAIPGFGQIYKWRDKDGNLRFSDTPPPGVKAEKVKVREGPAEAAPPGKTTPKAPKAEAATGKEEDPPGSSKKRSYQEIKVIMYMTDWCPYCRKAKEYLNSLGVNLTEYNIEKDRAKNEERKTKAGTSGVPVIDVEGIIIRGFSAEMIKAAVEKRRSI